MQSEIKKDVIAGFGVFLLALPLCLAIAIASGAPPIAGIFSAIIGGIVGYFSGGEGLTIKGPAAGMIVIVLGAVQELGGGDIQLGYKLALAVGVLAAIIQMAIAFAKKAVIAEMMPQTVIHGMLSAIGVIIISKQMYVLAGIAPTTTKPLSLIYHFPEQLQHLNPISLGIGLFAFGVAVFWPRTKYASFIPSSFVILATVIPLVLYFNLKVLAPKLLINLPHNLFEGIQFPDFSQVVSFTSLKYIVMFSLVGSIESLLTVCAMDSIRSDRTPSDLNKDLKALGVVNLVSALLGGLPVISEIVRSKANSDYGAVSQKANFFHGLFMLLAVTLFPSVINLIPLSALAALLIFVGLKLASIKEFQHAYKLGLSQFSVFLTTFIVTLEVDLLVGIIAGISLELLILWFSGHKFRDLFFPTMTVENKRDHANIIVDGPLTFLSYLKLKNLLHKVIKENKKVVISLHAVTYLDHTVIKKMQTLSHTYKDVTIIIDENQQLAKFTSF